MASDQPYQQYDNGPDYVQYVKLRTILDSLEIGALRYYLDNTTPEEKKERFEKIASALAPIIQMVWRGDEQEIAGDCPDGYRNCDGVCVPYDCFM